MLIGALLKVGVPYSEALTMPVPFALALLNGLSKNGRQNNSHSNTNGGIRKVATRRKSKENE
jgi:hypothetical protein